MTDEDWGAIDSSPDSDRKPPRWLWFCGCGCLVLLLAMVGALFGLRQVVQESTDVDLQWTRLGQVVECEQPAVGGRLVGGFTVPFIDVSFFVFKPHGDELGGVLFSIPAGDDGEEFRKELFDEEDGAEGEPCTILVQGRELHGMRGMDQSTAGSFRISTDKSKDAAHSMVLDLSLGGPSNVILVLFSEDHEIDEISDEAVRAFLKPLKIGPDWPVPDEVEVPEEAGDAEDPAPDTTEETQEEDPAEPAEKSAEETSGEQESDH